MESIGSLAYIIIEVTCYELQLAVTDLILLTIKSQQRNLVIRCQTLCQ